MQIYLITIGNRMPDWVKQGYQEYAKRLSGNDCRINLIEVPAMTRAKNADIMQIKENESALLLKAVPKNSQIIALDEHGQEWDTLTLANQLRTWQHDGRSLSLLIGGPDGLAASCLSRAEKIWSLSKLTLPHPLVRIIVAEQLYRAWSVLQKHPYHRS